MKSLSVFMPFILSLIALIAGWFIGPEGSAQWLRLTLLGISVALSSMHTFPEALQRLRRFTLDIDVLMFAAAIGASVIGHYEEGALLLWLFGLGHAGEEMATARSRRAIEALTHLAPESALRLDESGQESLVKLGDLQVGDRVRVKPFDRVPIDSVVIEGDSDVDESSLTGESIPISKTVDSALFAGTMNGPGRLLVRVTRLASDSTLARIIKLVEEAQSQKSPTQLFTDRIERFYVPIVFVVMLLIIFIPPLLGWTPRRDPGRLWGGWFYQAMAFLTAASPCALAIGTPTAILCGIARAARMGVLIKGGAHLESLGKLRAIAMDKTGTITAGKPVVDKVVTHNGFAIAVALKLAAAVDGHTSHPFAASIVNAAALHDARSLSPGVKLDATDVRQIPGEGVTGTIDGRVISVGKSTLAGPKESWPTDMRQAHESMQSGGFATAWVVQDGQPIAVMGLADLPRDHALEAIARLRELGIEEVAMLTGDHAAVAHAVAQRVGISQVHADLLPDQKLDLISRMEHKYGSVAMVGDGVNDAPALAKATLGIAMGAAGGHGAADVAIETADIVLMGQDLRRLGDAIDLARRARRIIAQNLVIALGVISVVAPLAAMGFANLGIAVTLHEGSTVIVVLNALRLLRAHDIKPSADAPKLAAQTALTPV